MKRAKGRSLQRRKKKATHIYPRDAAEWYVEPHWASVLLFEREPFFGRIHDPCAGFGRVAIEAARKLGRRWVSAADKVRRPRKLLEFDVTAPRDFMGEVRRFETIVSNPPYRLCYSRADFKMIRHMLKLAKRKVALLLPYGFQYGTENARFIRQCSVNMFGLARIYHLAPRPSMPPGPYILAGKRPGGGRVDFSWFIFVRGHCGPTTTEWLVKP